MDIVYFEPFLNVCFIITPTGKLYSHSMGYGNIQGGAATGGNISGTYNRVRSSSMSMIDRSEAAWAILGSTGGYRSKSKSDDYLLLFTTSCGKRS